MKKLLAILLSFLFLVGTLTACGSGGNGESDTTKTALEKIQAAGKLVVGTSPDYAPYEFLDPNKTGQDAVVGAEIELAKALCKELGVELVIEQLDFDTLITAVQQGKIDVAISGFTWKEDREGQVAFAGPYHTEGEQGLMILKKDADKYQTLADFVGKKIACQASSMQLELTTNQIKDAKIELITTIQDGVMMLQSGKVDAVAMASIPAQSYIDNYDTIAFAKPVFTTKEDGVYVLMKVELEGSDLYGKISQLVKKWDSDGTFSGWMDDATALQKSLGVE